MRTKVLIAILLLLMAISTIYASEDPTEITKEQMDKAEIQKFKERFESLVNAEGKIEYQPDQHKWIMFEGKILDISLSNETDSLQIRNIMNEILSRILPFTSAKRDHLQPIRLGIRPNTIQTAYIQNVNGYPIIGGGIISISYYHKNQEYLIGNSTFCEPDSPPTINITKAEAIAIALSRFPEYKLMDRAPDHKRLGYYPINQIEIVLCYGIPLEKYNVYVDAKTGAVRGFEGNTINMMHGEITGTYYEKDYISVPGQANDDLMPYVDYNISDGVHNSSQSGNFTIPSDELSCLSSHLGQYPSFNLMDFQTCNPIASASPQLVNDQISIHYYDDFQHNPNIYYHTADQLIGLESDFYNALGYPLDVCIWTGYETQQNIAGQFIADALSGSEWINIKQGFGLYSQVPRHEISHCWVYNSMSYHYFYPPTATYPDEYAAMDEALAIYLPCAVIGSPNCNYNCDQQYTPISDTVTVEYIRQHFYPGVPATSLNEQDYSAYMMGYPIASALWAIRAGFADISEFNDAISYVINQIGVVASANVNNTYRHKPRYFYNLLMQRVADSGQTTGLNDKQRAIDAAYSSRGLHFNPKVESVSSSLKARNIFRLNEPVHVKVSNCPQNTRINVYVIKHNDYTYLDGALTSSLCNHYAHGFTPNTTAITNSSGEWSGLIWTTPSSAEDAVGDYDIIVDIGSPTTPDGIIHFNFSAANVMDGIDGRTQPGFIVSDNGIDVVMAEQASAEAQIATAHQ